ncbi:dynein regulatory complex protein 9 [Astyanax mexicanus]|uniref:Dynein regulatory complex protein 9 n=2 Tax=Astyanax mexicanus TaxID=7994 RepID=A0A3B1JXI1_ASTMX|nr:dynein regulatory complex protein 9 [Astyanax mexicanus]KAG9272925.1 IQ domain-containing protein G-like [Astyanax mexicanus]
MSCRVSGVDRLRVCAVLERCADQLDILGHIMPKNRRSRPGAEEAEAAHISVIIKQHQAAESHLKTVRKSRVNDSELSEAVEELHLSQNQLRRTLEESSSSHNNLAKVERDRQFVAKVISDLLAEIQESGTFHSLVQATEEERKKSDGEDHLHDTVIREELRIKALRKQLVDVQEEKTSELERLEGIKVELEQQLQQITLKKNIEKNYATSSAELLIYQGQKLANQKEQGLEEEKKMLQAKIEEEIRVYIENESFLKTYQTGLEEKLDYWMERYEKHIEAKDQELTSLKSQRANTRAQLHSLAKKCREMERVITDDHLEKENRRQQLERQQLEREAATKIQAWWRGTLVRRGLVSNKNKSKKPKAKGGKKGKGKKK